MNNGLRSLENTIDYTCADKKRKNWRHLIDIDSLFQKTPMFTPKNEQLSQEMYLKILYFSSGLEMSRVVEKLLFTYL
jgi:hypothetical protein